MRNPNEPHLKFCYETFIKVTPNILTDKAPIGDDTFFASRGIESSSPDVLRHLSEDVLPMIRGLQRGGALEWYSFLVHAYPIVPTIEDDKAIYIHLRLAMRRNVAPSLPKICLFTRKWKWSREIAGVDPAAMDIKQAWLLIGKQSEWMLDLLEAQKKQRGGVDEYARLKHMRQFLHFYANASQMRVA